MQQKPGTSPKRVILARELAQAAHPSGSSFVTALRWSGGRRRIRVSVRVQCGNTVGHAARLFAYGLKSEDVSSTEESDLGKSTHSRRSRGRAPLNTGSLASLFTVRSPFSVLSFWSVGSILSVGSVLSIGSAGSILSIGSAGSILSIGSAGSILSIGGGGSSSRTDSDEPVEEEER